MHTGTFITIETYFSLFLPIGYTCGSFRGALGHVIEMSAIIHSYELSVFVAVLEEPLAA